MKIMLLVLGACFLSAALLARDLPGLAKRERERRRALAVPADTGARVVRSFDDDDLERIRRLRGDAGPDAVRRPARSAPPAAAPRGPSGSGTADDLARQKRYWREQTARHERELARLDASIRKLEWRLVERRNRRKPGDRLADDPTSDMLEDSIENLREQRRLLEERFRNRARKAGALPGWLRP